MPMCLGLDLGGSSLKVAIKANGSLPEVVSRVKEYSLDNLPELLKGFQVSAVGVSCSGDLDYEHGVIRKSLRLGENIPIAEIVTRTFKDLESPVRILNDSQCATLAELKLGIGRQANSFLFINLGSNPGGGVVLDGRLLLNSNGRNLGRIGHFCIDPKGPICRCGKQGCLDAYVSVKSILKLANELLDQEISSLEEIDYLAAQGARRAAYVWEQVAKSLAIAVVNLSNFLGLERVVIGGGISLADKWLLEPLQASVNELSRYPVVISRGQVDPRTASVQGAAVLAETQLVYQT